jgi:hypothetical protein
LLICLITESEFLLCRHRAFDTCAQIARNEGTSELHACTTPYWRRVDLLTLATIVNILQQSHICL